MNSFKFVLLLANLLLIKFSLINTANLNEDLEDARLLVVKNVLNNYIVEGLDVEVKYSVYNIGNLAALNVKLLDENFPADKFEYVTGFNTARWSRIPPANNVTHVTIVRPKISGLYNFTHATITYLPNEKASKVQTGYTTEIGEVYIQKLKEYNRRFASHTVDWILFAIMASPSIVFPYFLWYSSKKKYEKNDKSKSAKSN